MNNQIGVIWAGDQTLFATFTIPNHSSARSIAEDYLPELEDIFGEGVELKAGKNENTFLVNVDKVEK